MSIGTFSNVWDMCTQSGTALLIMLAIADHTNEDGACQASNSMLADRARVTESELASWLGYLESQNEIALIRRGIQLANSYCQEQSRSLAQQAKKPIPGFVYILKAATGEYKIGLTRDPDSRMATFGLMLPFRVTYELVVASEDMRALEKSLHMEFEHKRIDGEWFALTPEDVVEIKKRFSADE